MPSAAEIETLLLLRSEGYCGNKTIVGGGQSVAFQKEQLIELIPIVVKQSTHKLPIGPRHSLSSKVKTVLSDALSF